MSTEKSLTPEEEKQLENALLSTDKYSGMSLDDLRERANKRKRKLAPVEATPHMKLYAQKVNGIDKQETDLSLNGLLSSMNKSYGAKGRPVTPYPISFEDARALFFAIIAKELEINGRGLIIEPKNSVKIDELIKYFTGAPDGKLNPHKGIYLYGPVGRGKTMIMQCLMMMCAVIESKLEAAGAAFTSHKFAIANAQSMVKEVDESKGSAVMRRYYKGQWCIDDLGAEDGLKQWGNDKNIVADIIIERYQAYQRSGLLTHATSNTIPKEWTAKYGQRVDSRCYEMFELVQLVGEDKRKMKS